MPDRILTLPYRIPIMEKQKTTRRHFVRLILASLLVGTLSTLLALALKHTTEFAENLLFDAASRYRILYIVLPVTGIAIISYLRKRAFGNRKNKGITEIYNTIDRRREHLPAFKIPSHILNGFLTVSSGGSTGIEVSTVVATAAIGNVASKKGLTAAKYKTELICAAVAGGVSALFVSPLAGWLFALEVIARKPKKTIMVSCAAAALASWSLIFAFGEKPMLPFQIHDWYWRAMPFFIAVSLLCALLSVYFTWLVTRLKKILGNIRYEFPRMAGAIALGLIIFLFPTVYGDSYHGLSQWLSGAAVPAGIFLLVALLKPLASSLTLAAGGDGGVFAPSIVSGALLGMFVATACNAAFGTGLIVLNFALVGAAATLSASIYAPITAVILVCGLIDNGYQLFVPVLAGSIVSRYFAAAVLPYNVYTYDFYVAKTQGEP